MNKITKQLIEERDTKYDGGLYRLSQILFAYNSNHIEGSTLTEEQTRYIYDTGYIKANNENGLEKVNDIIETKNHFRLFDFMLDTVNESLTENLIKNYHHHLKNGTADADKGYKVGAYKSGSNLVGNIITATPEEVPDKMYELLITYRAEKMDSLKQIANFHAHFETIHPFQDGNGRVGRMIMFRECLAHNIMPFIVNDERKHLYYQGLQEYYRDGGKKLMDYFQMEQAFYQDIAKQYTMRQ